MAHPKITQTRTFTDEFEEILALSSDQVRDIDELDYQLLKENMFSSDPNYDEKKARFKHLRSIARTLNNIQITKLKSIIKNQKKKQATYNFETIKSERLQKKYKHLNFSEDRYLQFRTKLDEVEHLSRKMFNESLKNHKLRKPHHKRFIEAANIILKDFLTPQELTSFHKIEEGEYQFTLNTRSEVIKHSYSTLNLNEKQATQIFHYEEDEPATNEQGAYYSELEKLELTKQFMKSILNEEQFISYIPIWNQRKDDTEEGIISNNELKLQEINRLQNRKEFLLSTYLPILCQWRSEIESFLDINLKQHIAVLRTEYQEKISTLFDKHKKEASRHYKNLYPNYILQLEIELQIRALLPDANYLEETKNILSHITPELRNIILKSTKAVKNINHKLNQFEIDNYENTGGTYGGWVSVIRNPNNEKSENILILSTLLLEPLLEKNIQVLEKFQVSS